METIVETVVAILPLWALWPIVVVIGLLMLWERARILWRDVVPYEREQKRTREALELLKLWYEIEALRKANDLESKGETYPRFLSEALSRAQAPVEHQAKHPAPAKPPPSRGRRETLADTFANLFGAGALLAFVVGAGGLSYYYATGERTATGEPLVTLADIGTFAAGWIVVFFLFRYFGRLLGLAVMFITRTLHEHDSDGR